MPGDCAMCGLPDNAHRTLDAVVDRVVAGEPIVSVASDFESFTPREVWLMTTAVLSERAGNTRSDKKRDRVVAEWRAFVDREGWEYEQSRDLPEPPVQAVSK